MRRTFLIVVAVALVGGLAGAGIGVALADGNDATSTAADAATVTIESRGPASGDGLTPESIYRLDAPGVVVITATQTQVVPPTLFSPGQKQQVTALGSGFVIDRRGNIVTNDHVVQGAKQVRVGFSSGASYPAKIVGADPSSDVAVVRVQAPSSALHPLAFHDSAKIEVGDPVYAIGNPFGLDRTMTAGIVSAVGREIQSPNGLTIPKAIQTDAPINHGNSGGPLIDRFGRVVGINTQIQGGTVNANVGIGFAVSSDTASSTAAQLIKTGRAEHAWLGVGITTIEPGVVKAVRGLPPHGAVITRVVKGSPAQKAGLRAATRQVTVNGVSVPVGGDVIVAVDGKSVDSSSELAALVALRRPGDKITFEVVRDGRHRKVEVTLGNVPAPS